MEVLPYLHETQHRLTYAARKYVECNEFADRQVARDHEASTKIQDASCHELVDELNAVTCIVSEPEDPETRSYVPRQLLLPASLHLRLDRHCLQRIDTIDAFDKKSLVLSTTLKFLV